MKDAHKIGILSLGCPRNLADSENILGRLAAKGHSVVEMEDADIGIINTCAFIEEAKEESVDAILDMVELKKEGKLKKIIVYGCLPARYKDKLHRVLPEVDAFVGRISLNHSPKNFPLTPAHYAYLKICEGCVNNCSYCVIPKIKGSFASLDIGSLLGRMEILSKNKVSEVNIIGQDITAYGLDLYGKPALPALLKKIIKKGPDVGWLRLLYLNPERVTGELLELIKNEPKICKYIDLPLQHINDRILKLMRRNTSRSEILEIIDKIRKVIPGAAIRTSVIVGFPSETEKDFKELLDFIRDAKFERLGAFVYSREEGTSAYCFKKQVPAKIKQERFDAVMMCQQEVSRDINGRFLGRVIDVLIDEKGEGFYLGRSQYDAPEVDGLIYVDSGKRLKPGDFARVEITDTLEYDLVGKAL